MFDFKFDVVNPVILGKTGTTLTLTHGSQKIVLPGAALEISGNVDAALADKAHTILEDAVSRIKAEINKLKATAEDTRGKAVVAKASLDIESDEQPPPTPKRK